MIQTALCIPVLNEEKLITNFFQSVVCQTAPKKSFMVVIADNGSTDQTYEKIRSFQKKYPSIHVEVCFEKTKGIGPARKHALETGLKLGAKHLLSVDADSVLPRDFIAQGTDILARSSLNVLEGKIKFSDYLTLIMILYFKKLMRVMRNLSDLDKSLFGPVMYGSYMGINSRLFEKIYLGDIYNPLIFEEDFMISRRAFFLGARFVKPTNCVLTSDRRIWANTFDWMAHKRVVGETVDTSKTKDHFVPPKKREIEKAIKIRIKDSTNKILKTLLDIKFLSSLTNSYKYNTGPVLHRACKTLNIRESLLGRVSFIDRFDHLKNLDQKVGEKLLKVVTNYALK